MADEKRFEDLTPEELKSGVLEFFRQSQPAQAAQPDAPGCEGLSDAAREVARTLYGQDVLRKQAGQLSAQDVDFLRKGITAWERGDQ